MAAAAGTTLLVGGAAAIAVAHGPGPAHPAARGLADAVRVVGSGAPASGPAPAGHVNAEWLRDIFAEPASAAPSGSRPQDPKASPEVSRAPAAPPPPVYANPFRAVSGLRPERVDMGADFGGSGPVYALGHGVITSATGDSAGWPGGGWITYRLTDGPAAGLSVYVAEDVTPAVQVGQEVSSATVIANMFDGSAGIETGWAQPGGGSAESQLAAAGAISGGGPFPTRVGLSFDELLQALGVPDGSNAAEAASGILPPGYPSDWTAATLRP
ncbi:MAG TPA: hypothetical protein VGM79_02755 [Streptosporangiaceae bacterium]|jgi:hypothetical protein